MEFQVVMVLQTNTRADVPLVKRMPLILGAKEPSPLERTVSVSVRAVTRHGRRITRTTQVHTIDSLSLSPNGCGK